MRLLLGAAAAVVVFAALRLAETVIAPVAFALFIIAIVWPLQRTLQPRLTKAGALVVSMAATLLVVAAIVLVVAWGFNRVGQWVFANASQMQALFAQKVEWLETHGIVVGGVLAEHFDVRLLVRVFQGLTGQLQGLLAFAVVTLIYTLLGLLEVDATADRLAAMPKRETGSRLRAASAAIAAKLQKYMAVRTLASVATGLAVWGYAAASGLDLAVEWGVIAFALNYIPFLGPLVATLMPTAVAALQFGSFESAITVFLALNVIQFIIGSYLEPRIAGAALAISPTLTLFAVFFGSFIWGIAGAFIGVPIMIALVTLWQHDPDRRWLADLLGGQAK